MVFDHLCVTLVPLFNHLDKEDQARINQLLHHQVFQKGEQITTPAGEAQLVIVKSLSTISSWKRTIIARGRTWGL